MIWIFCWGAFGSLAVELITILTLLKSPAALPAYYSTLSFWVVRILVMLLAGGVAVANDVRTAALAIQIGACTPLIIQALTRGMQE
jgi:hypothetical protein